MFRNRSVQMKFVKDEAVRPAKPSLLEDLVVYAVDKTEDINVKRVVLGSLATYATVKTIQTLSTVVINITAK